MEKELKMRCLELAVELKAGSTADANCVVREAETFLNFVIDKKENTEDNNVVSGNQEVALDNKTKNARHSSTSKKL